MTVIASIINPSIACSPRRPISKPLRVLVMCQCRVLMVGWVWREFTREGAENLHTPAEATGMCVGGQVGPSSQPRPVALSSAKGHETKSFQAAIQHLVHIHTVRCFVQAPDLAINASLCFLVPRKFTIAHDALRDICILIQDAFHVAFRYPEYVMSDYECRHDTDSLPQRLELPSVQGVGMLSASQLRVCGMSK